MLVLGLDPGTRCGWALRRTDGPMDSGVWDLTPARDEGPGSRYLKLSCHLVELAATHEIGAVYYEMVHHHAAVRAAHVYGGLLAFIQAFAEKRGIRHFPVYVASAKVLATGKVHASKQEMGLAARARWPGWTFEDDNEVDARFILEAGLLGKTGKKKDRRPA